MIRFGSRGSDLARAQTRQVAERLRQLTGEDYSIEIIETRGDKILDQPLHEVGGKGLFTAELEAALRSGRIDAAVHSLKDLPVEDPEDLTLGAIPERVAPHDVLLYRPELESSEGGTLPIEDGVEIGTSSPRRAAAVLAHRPHLRVKDIRGNVPTRVAKLRKGDYGGILLAAAGLSRLDLSTAGLGFVPLPTDTFTPAPGQGALGVQCRRQDPVVRQLLNQLHDPVTAARVDAERGLLAALEGGCSMPLGALVDRVGAGYRMQATLYAQGSLAHRYAVELHGPDPAELSRQASAALRPLTGEPLTGLRVCLVRPGAEGGSMASGLAVAGADVQPVALTEVRPVRVDDEAMRQIRDLDAVAFTSTRAVSRYFELAAIQGVALDGKRFFAGGPATAAAVRSRGLTCKTPNVAGGAALAELILDGGAAGTVLFPCAVGRRPELEAVAAQGGVKIAALPVYETRAIAGVQLPDGPWHYTVFTSPSAVDAFRDGGHRLQGKALAIGPTTAEAMASAGVPADAVADQPTPQALTQRITELQNAHST